MANYQLLKADIDAKVYQNGGQEITGENLNSVLNQMVNILGTGYQFAGVATKDTNPETTDAKVFYFANGKGTYTHFDNIDVTEDDVVILYYDNTWHKVATGIASQAKLSELEGEVDELKGGIKELNLNNYPKSKLFPSSEGVWRGSNDNKIVISVKPGDNYIIKSNADYSSYYSFIKTYDGNEKYDDMVDYVTSNPIYAIYPNTEEKIVIPNECNYLCIRMDTSLAPNYTPSSLSKDYGNIGLSKVDNEIVKIKDNIDDIELNLDSLINYDVTLSAMVYGKYLKVDGFGESVDVKRAYCDTFFKVATKKYKIENQASYKITLYYYNQDKSFNSYQGWFTAGVVEFTPPIDGFVRISIMSIDDTEINSNNYIPIHILRQSDLNSKLGLAENAVALYNPFAYANILHHMNVERSSNIGVPSQSLYDIAYARALGAKVIEANTQKTSDNVWVVKHGNSGKLGNGLNFGNSGYTADTLFSDVDSDILRREVSYISNDTKFNGSHIPTLSEFCDECNRQNMIVLLQVKEKSILDEARKYLPDNRIIAYGLTERGNFRGFMTDFITSSNKDSILENCLAKGYPYIFSWANYPTADKSLVREVVKTLHEYGFLISAAYLNPNQTIEAFSDGLDMIASTYYVTNPETQGNFMELYDGSTGLTYEGGASYDESTKTINMPAGSKLYIYNPQVASMYMNYTLEIMFKGKVDITMGNNSVVATTINAYSSLLSLESQGEKVFQFSQANLIGNGVMLLIIAREETTIANLHYMASRKF